VRARGCAANWRGRSRKAQRPANFAERSSDRNRIEQEQPPSSGSLRRDGNPSDAGNHGIVFAGTPRTSLILPQPDCRQQRRRASSSRLRSFTPNAYTSQSRQRFSMRHGDRSQRIRRSWRGGIQIGATFLMSSRQQECAGRHRRPPSGTVRACDPPQHDRHAFACAGGASACETIFYAARLPPDVSMCPGRPSTPPPTSPPTSACAARSNFDDRDLATAFGCGEGAQMLHPMSRSARSQLSSMYHSAKRSGLGRAGITYRRSRRCVPTGSFAPRSYRANKRHQRRRLRRLDPQTRPISATTTVYVTQQPRPETPRRLALRADGGSGSGIGSGFACDSSLNC